MLGIDKTFFRNIRCASLKTRRHSPLGPQLVTATSCLASDFDANRSKLGTLGLTELRRPTLLPGCANDACGP